MPGHADPREALIRQALRLQRVSNSIAAERSGLIRALFDDVAALVAKIDPTGPGPRRYQQMRVGRLLEEVERLTGETFTEWHQATRNDLARVGRAEALQTRADLVVSLGDAGDLIRDAAPTQNMMKAILDRNPFQGETLKGWAEVQEIATVRRIRQQVQIGMMAEEGIDDLVRRVRGRSNGRGGYVGGVMQTTTREASALVRTAVTDIAAEARLETFRGNPRVVNAVVWVSSLDSRTCVECGGLDGETWTLDEEGHVKPPAHISCRCSLLPEVDWEGLGIEPPEASERAARDADGNRIQVSGDTTYEDWLRSQPASVQDEILGPGRAELFRNQQTRLDQLVGQDRRVLTLEELERSVGVRGRGGPPVGRFEPAETIEEAEGWARANVANDVNFGDMDVTVANEVNRGLHEMVNVHGYQRVEELAFAPGGSAYADAFAGRRIRIRSRQDNAARNRIATANAAKYDELKERRVERIAEQEARVARLEEEGDARALRRERKHLRALQDNPVPDRWAMSDAPGGDGWFRTTIHEFGHIAHYRSGRNGLFRHEVLSGIENQALNSSLQAKIGKKGVAAARRISEYATANTHEYFAEAWTAYHTGHKHLLADDVIELIEAIIEFEKTGTTP